MAAGEVAEERGLPRELAVERWQSAGLALKAVSRLQMEARAQERVQRARAGSVAGADRRPSAVPMVVRASSSVSDEMISEEVSMTSHSVSMTI